MRRVLSFAVLVVISGCGGGGGDSQFQNSVDGRWSGPLRQSSCLRCNDGSTQCVGVGRVTRSVTIEFIAEPATAGDGEQITAVLDGCTYSGERNVSFPFTLAADGECSGTLEVESIDGGSMQVAFDSGPVPPAPPLGCSLAEEGVLRRD